LEKNLVFLEKRCRIFPKFCSKNFSLFLCLSFTGTFLACSKLVPAPSTQVKVNNQALNKTAEVDVVPGPLLPGEYFIDKTNDYGLSQVQATHLYAVDFNLDGHVDLVTLPTHYSIPEFYSFNPKVRKFQKVGYNPFPEIFRAHFLSFVDLNKDGLLDVIVGSLNQKNELTQYPLRLFRAKKNADFVSYEEVKDAFPNYILPNSSISVFDYDLDGNLDLYQGNWFKESLDPSKGPELVGDKLYRGKNYFFQDVSFLLEEEKEFSYTESDVYFLRPTYGVSSCDIDQNGFPDIMTSSSSGYENKLYLNLAKVGFSDRYLKNFARTSGFGSDENGLLSPRGGGNSFFSVCADYNNDSFMDVVQGELIHPYDEANKDRSSILTGTSSEFPPKFLRTDFYFEQDAESSSQGHRRGLWVDLNSDGLLDLVVENSGFPPHSRAIVFIQESNHAFVDKSRELGLDVLNPSGTVSADVNQDGKIDLIMGQSNIRDSKLIPRLYLFENQMISQHEKNIKIYLQGKYSNINALGAMVILKTNKEFYRRYVEYSYGPMPSQNESFIHFAWNDPEEQIEEIEVRWPIALKDSSGRHVPLSKKYLVKNQLIKSSTTLTLCETGKILEKKASCPEF
jgi:enediyne biosynthesis protein E4